MKKVKRILAMIGVILLIGLYLTTLLCALFVKENLMTFLMASIYATFIIPVLLWAYSFIYKLVKKNNDNEKDTIL